MVYFVLNVYEKAYLRKCNFDFFLAFIFVVVKQ